MSASPQQIREWIREADELLEKGDIVQTSEKYYKAVEEAIKSLSRRSNLSVLKRLRYGRWSSELLFDAVYELGVNEIKEIWYIAWELHIDGFHEMKLTEERLRLVKDKIKKIIDYL
ncbi:hypothetical protein J5U23_01392 [Saccharolobus shibatae B12]|uniref:PaREP1 family protein n=1 Tax=Saccharolobus shibatae (strain ATCC 51178 / DSM 5389 / JCM 8931 / NBRC 15437 / B12) TaxID=523848 RepID=A0A8F5BNR6_SACSH|nr:PaREP1 family protein [Saccharolobus shibatae]QXJ28523.1 hypothetical protein J5U23_01392 [Saccharolobus shibatae B12]